MTTILSVFDLPVIRSLGWALLHFVWQAAILVSVAGVLQFLLRRSSAQVRYVMLCGVLLLIAACPIVTWCWVAVSTPAQQSLALNVVEQVHSTAPSVPTETQADNSGPQFPNNVALDEQIAVSNEPGVSSVQSQPWVERWRASVDPVLPWLVGAWWIGVIALSLRLLVGWRIVQRIRRQSSVAVADVWQTRLATIATRLRVNRPIQLVESALVEVPTVIGILRPMILLPASVLTGLTPEQVEAVLAHEVAHIRRHDFLVNLFQTAIEVLLFYHPAVWWLSHQIRNEREHCCDDIAVAMCGDRVTYVQALTNMEQLRSGTGQPALAVAASGGSLLQRVRRIASQPAPSTRGWTRGSGLSAVLTMAVLGLTAYVISQSGLQAHPMPDPHRNDVALPETPNDPEMLAADTAIPKSLTEKLDLAIELASQRILTANLHSPWQIFQGLMALKGDFLIQLDDRKVNAIEWISMTDPQYQNEPLLQKTQYGGKFHSFTRPAAFEGVPGHFLAVVSEVNLPVDHSFKVGTEQITVSDIVNNTKKEVNVREEATYVLWGLQHYLDPDTKWANKSGEEWSIERLVEMETSASLMDARNGGNDQLIALARTRDKYLRTGRQLMGVWEHADAKIRKQIELAKSRQIHDGTFSSKFPGLKKDLNHRLGNSGHIMEFLSIALPDTRLNEAWVQTAASALCDDLITNQKEQIAVDPFYHTLNALIIYRDRTRLVAAAPDDAQAQIPAAQDSQWGTDSNGLRFRVVPVPATTDAKSPDITKSASTFANGDDVTFAVELKNVSDKAITVLGVKYGDSYPTARGQLNTAFFGPHLFELDLTDSAGKAVTRAARKPERDALVLSGASAHVLEPGKSLIELIQPARFMLPFDYQIAPGQYRVKVRYKGPDEQTIATIKKHWPDKPQVVAWTHSVTSNEVAITVADDPNALKRAELKWGPAKDGLQAAIEFRKLPPRNGTKGPTGSPHEAPGVPLRTRIGVTFHVKNVSDKVITFASEAGRQGDSIHVKDADGKDVPIRSAFFTGAPVMVRWTLKPGDVARLSVLTPDVSSISAPGKYTVRYTIRFNSLRTSTFPLKDDWQSELETGETELFIRESTPEDDASERPPTFVGRVEFVGPNGQPVETGTFHYSGELGKQDLPIRRGPIEIPNCTAQSAVITVMAPGFEEARYVYVDLSADSVKRFELIPAVPSRVKLVTPDGKPIAGAKIRFFNKTCGLASAGPIPMHGLTGPVWATTQADGTTVIDHMQRVDPYYKDLGDAVYYFCIEAPANADPKLTPPPRVIGPVKAGQDLGAIKLGPPLEVRGEIRGTAEELKNFAAEWDQPVKMTTDNPTAAWDYAVSQRLETTRDGDKLMFRLTGLTPGRLRIISNFGPGPHRVSHTYSRRDPSEGDVVVAIDNLSESLTDLVITPKGRLDTPKP